MLKIYNTLDRKKEEFKPLKSGEVKMYVCGPTVYDVLHVGNFRGVIFFNLVRNWLERSGHKVTYVYNYTDVDDKIIKRANDEGKQPEIIAATYIAEFEKDFKSLHLTAHDHNPKATEYISQMVNAIKLLIEHGHAYVIDGQVFYSVDSFKNYGKLSNKNLEELNAGHRIEVDPRKKNALDFVLWKPSKEGEPSWDSPWGFGRPGWHIECSVMSKALLGDSIDIHGGGIDLIFPHHENEIAQSEGVTNKPFVRYWMHNNFINFGDTKMSKSLGNVVTGRSFLEKYNAEVFKYLILSVHYRSPLSLADSQIQQAIAALARIYSALRSADELINSSIKEDKLNPEFEKFMMVTSQSIERALDDDFNTPMAFAAIFDLVRSFNAMLPKNYKPTPALKRSAIALKELVLGIGKLMSLFQEPSQAFLRQLDLILLREKSLLPEEIDRKVAERTVARQSKDFKRADALRDELTALGIEIKDGVSDTGWEVKKG